MGLHPTRVTQAKLDGPIDGVRFGNALLRDIKVTSDNGNHYPPHDKSRTGAVRTPRMTSMVPS